MEFIQGIYLPTCFTVHWPKSWKKNHKPDSKDMTGGRKASLPYCFHFSQ